MDPNIVMASLKAALSTVMQLMRREGSTRTRRGS